MNLEESADVERILRIKTKALLRQRARALRSNLPVEAVADRSAAILRALERLPEVLKAKSVAFFHPIEQRREVDLRALDATLAALGVRRAYPAIDPDTRRMTFRFVDDPSSLAERGFGFREPAPDAPEAESLDVILVPALQVDPSGHRIGYGAGFYDRTLPRFAPPAATLCVAYDFQLIPEVPVTEGDVAVDLVVTDRRVIRVSHVAAA